MPFYHITKTTNGNYRLNIDNAVDPVCAGWEELFFVQQYCRVKYGVTPTLNIREGTDAYFVVPQDETHVTMDFITGLISHCQSLGEKLAAFITSPTQETETANQLINYELLYQFAEAKRISYKELCAVFRAAMSN